jgi:hypothetical protein
MSLFIGLGPKQPDSSSSLSGRPATNSNWLPSVCPPLSRHPIVVTFATPVSCQPPGPPASTAHTDGPPPLLDVPPSQTPPIFLPCPSFARHEKLSSPHSLLSLLLMFSSAPKLPGVAQLHPDDVSSALAIGVRHSALDFTNPLPLPSLFGVRPTLHKIPSIDELLTSLLFPGSRRSRPRSPTIAGVPHRH